jgi:hypothetical protein
LIVPGLRLLSRAFLLRCRSPVSWRRGAKSWQPPLRRGRLGRAGRGKPRTPMRATSEPLAPPQVVADYFSPSATVNSGQVPSGLHFGKKRGTPHPPPPISCETVMRRAVFCSARRVRRRSAESCQQRPKLPVTPYPGRFCRELLCFDDFTAQPCP